MAVARQRIGAQTGCQTLSRGRRRITCAGDAGATLDPERISHFQEPATMSIVRRLFASASPSTPQIMIALHSSASGGRQWDAYTKLVVRRAEDAAAPDHRQQLSAAGSQGG
jgi:hypothetical protein